LYSFKEYLVANPFLYLTNPGVEGKSMLNKRDNLLQNVDFTGLSLKAGFKKMQPFTPMFFLNPTWKVMSPPKLIPHKKIGTFGYFYDD